MNWNKVQNILIVTFLMLNIVLWYANTVNAESYELSKEREDELIKILENNDILVYEEVFPKHKPMQQLKVDQQEVAYEKVIQNKYGNIKDHNITIQDTFRRYEKDGQIFYFYTNGDYKGLVRYFNVNTDEAIEFLDEKTALKMAKDFIKVLDYKDAIWEPTFVKIINEDNLTYGIQFNEYYKGYPTLSSYVKFIINKNGVVFAEAKRVVPEKFLGEKERIYTVDEILYTLIEDIKYEREQVLEQSQGDQKINIIDIDIGYGTSNHLEEQKSLLNPYYRICLDNGSTYYVNAISKDKNNPIKWVEFDYKSFSNNNDMEVINTKLFYDIEEWIGFK